MAHPQRVRRAVRAGNRLGYSTRLYASLTAQLCLQQKRSVLLDDVAVSVGHSVRRLITTR